ncbi:hypothetical protein FOA52_009298 [Chlamydomonas sp. UWO 241]|nr:hypothetical protein FOA52_009298 [Chlamydomonas sp. UWO 241]
MPEPPHDGAGSAGAGGSGSMAAGGSGSVAAVSPSSGGPKCSACPRTLTQVEQRLALASGGKCMSCIAAGVPGGSACRVCSAGFGPADAAPVQCAQCALLMHATCAAIAANSPPGAPSGGLRLCPSCQGALSQVQQQSRAMLVAYEMRLRQMKPARDTPRDTFSIFQSDMTKVYRESQGAGGSIAIDPKDLVPIIAAAWHQLTPDERRGYDNKAAAEKATLEAAHLLYIQHYREYVRQCAALRHTPDAALAPLPALLQAVSVQQAAQAAYAARLQQQAQQALAGLKRGPQGQAPGYGGGGGGGGGSGGGGGLLLAPAHQNKARKTEESGAGPSTQALPEGVPSEVRVMCNNRPGVMQIPSTRVSCGCGECRAQGDRSKTDFIPTQWEAHCGQAAAKKWKMSIKVTPGGAPDVPSFAPAISIGKWLEIHGIDTRTRAPVGGAGGAGGGGGGGHSHGHGSAAQVKVKLEGVGMLSWRPWEDEAKGAYQPVKVKFAGDRCAACDSDVDYDYDQLVSCDKCGITVHQSCYGISELPDVDEMWMCRPCELHEKGQRTPQCCLCPVTGGALKPATIPGLWVHAACMQWIPEVQASDFARMEPIEGVESVQKERWELTCCVCKQRMGAKIQCDCCYAAFHPLCARMAGLHLEMREVPEGSGRLKFMKHCPKHYAPRPHLSGVKPDTGDADNEEGARNALWNRQPFRPPVALPVPCTHAGCARAQSVVEGHKQISHGTGAGCTTLRGFWLPQPQQAASLVALLNRGGGGAHKKARKASSSGGLGLTPYKKSRLARAGGAVSPLGQPLEPTGPPPAAELMPLPEGVPETVVVACNGRLGVFHVRTQRVSVGDDEMSASKFEAQCGKGDAKKWKSTLYAATEDGQPLCQMQDWIARMKLDRNALARLLANAVAVEAYEGWLFDTGQAGGMGEGDDGEEEPSGEAAVGVGNGAGASGNGGAAAAGGGGGAEGAGAAALPNGNAPSAAPAAAGGEAAEAAVAVAAPSGAPATAMEVDGVGEGGGASTAAAAAGPAQQQGDAGEDEEEDREGRGMLLVRPTDADRLALLVGYHPGGPLPPAASDALPPGSASSQPAACVGHCVRMYWPDDDAWYVADVLSYDSATKAHTLWYHLDEENETLDVAKEEEESRVQWLPRCDASMWPLPPRPPVPPARTPQPATPREGTPAPAQAGDAVGGGATTTAEGVGATAAPAPTDGAAAAAGGAAGSSGQATTTAEPAPPPSEPTPPAAAPTPPPPPPATEEPAPAPPPPPPPPSRPVPPTVNVVCNHMAGVFNVGTVDVTLPDGQIISATEFERLAGKGSSKKWKTSLRIMKADGWPGITIQDWMIDYGLEGPKTRPALSAELWAEDRTRRRPPTERVDRIAAAAASGSGAGASGSGGGGKGGAGNRDHRPTCQCVVCKQGTGRADGAQAAGVAAVAAVALRGPAAGRPQFRAGKNAYVAATPHLFGGLAAHAPWELPESRAHGPDEWAAAAAARDAEAEAEGGGASRGRGGPREGGPAAAPPAAAAAAAAAPPLVPSAATAAATATAAGGGGGDPSQPAAGAGASDGAPLPLPQPQPGSAGGGDGAGPGGSNAPNGGAGSSGSGGAPAAAASSGAAAAPAAAALPLPPAARERQAKALPWRERLRLCRAFERERLAFGKSGVHGWGIFAKRAILQDTPVFEYRGDSVRSIVADLREQRYRTEGRDCYLFFLNEHVVLDATTQGSISRFTNHCCAPSLYTKNVDYDGESHVVFFTKSDIRVGQELTFDYRFKQEDDADKVPCHCGAPSCKGFLN